MQYESKLIPIMREGVDIIKMVLFKELKAYLSRKHPGREPGFVSRLSGAMINDLFGAPSLREPFMTFAEENRALIEEEMRELAASLENMRIPLTDALRVQFLCDDLEGVDSSPMLQHARDLDILIVDREAPLPARFASLVRKLGGSLNLLVGGA